MISPLLDQAISEVLPSVKLVKVNVDNNPETAAQYNVRSLPTVAVFYEGQIRSQFLGYQNIDYLRNFVQKASQLSKK